MKVSLYFFDNYTNVSIWIAGLLWIIFFFPFYTFIKNDKLSKTKSIIYSLICSLIMASVFCLTFSKTLVEYVVFLTGIGFLVFGSLLASSTHNHRRLYFILGMLSCLISSVILWFFRTKVYKSGLPDTPGRLDTFFNTGGIVWNVIMVAMILYLLK